MVNRIKAMRLEQRLSLDQLSASAGVSKPYLFDLENGRRGAKPETLARIAAALGVTVADLRGDDHDKLLDHP